jgi:hypothetical protein
MGMPWDRALSQPIVLKDGRVITTLAGVRELLIAIPPRYRQGEVWRYVGELLNDAANNRATVDELAEMLARGLKGAGLL